MPSTIDPAVAEAYAAAASVASAARRDKTVGGLDMRFPLPPWIGRIPIGAWFSYSLVGDGGSQSRTPGSSCLLASVITTSCRCAPTPGARSVPPASARTPRLIRTVEQSRRRNLSSADTFWVLNDFSASCAGPPLAAGDFRRGDHRLGAAFDAELLPDRRALRPC